MSSRYAVEVRGIVQGVGFRPFVFRLAEELSLRGWVYNYAGGVSLEIEGIEGACQDFIRRLAADAPLLARVDDVRATAIAPTGEMGFFIRESRVGERNTLVSPDMGLCAECLADIRDPGNRRYGYAFTNCTNCGPRFTIIRDLPYDRPATTMSVFPMCGDCEAEYHDPRDRRFHAQPNACPVCGPRLLFRDKRGNGGGENALEQAQELLKAGKILAVKGLGGYHLACDALNNEAVEALRRRKYRWDKPFAVMTADRSTAGKYCIIDSAEATLLESQRRPIVLLRKRADGYGLAEQIAPNNGRLGIMLPYTPLHYLLMEGFDALVMTSGNISDEPIAYEDEAAFIRLAELADGFLYHDRAIFRRCDDSVAVYAAGAARLLRRSRGFAPEPLWIADSGRNILACGAEQKNTFCLTRGPQAFISQHIGDLINISTLRGYQREIEYFRKMFNSRPDIIAYDMHPEYLSTNYALAYESNAIRIPVQHHHAHLASVLAERRLDTAMIGLIFDGTGYGTDGKLWGGEVLTGDCRDFRRFAHNFYLPLPGGEQAIHEPWRQAMAALLLAEGQEKLTEAAPAGLLEAGWETLVKAMERGINTPQSSGMGRIFDAAAALVGIGRRVNYEGQAAVELEQAIDDKAEGSYHFAISQDDTGYIMDWRPALTEMAAEARLGEPIGAMALRFHRAVVEISVEVCKLARAETGLNEVALSGGCWQNVWLLEHVWQALEAAGFAVFSNSLAPMNDGGIAYGQAAVAAAKAMRREI